MTEEPNPIDCCYFLVQDSGIMMQRKGKKKKQMQGDGLGNN
ncbi:unnamed protein product, partial [Linum tenue]